MFSTFKRCPKKFYWTYIRGIAPNQKHTKNDLYFGQMLHKAVEVYFEEGLEAALEVWSSYDVEQSDRDKNAEIGLILTQMLPEKFDYKCLCTERPFTINVGVHQWKGRFDGVIEWSGGLYVVDHKTTRWSFRQTKPNDQFISYYLGGKVYYKDVIGLIVNEFNVTSLDISKKIIQFSDDEVNEWINETKAILAFIARCISSKVFPKTPDCFKYNTQCPYLQLCNSSESMQEKLIKSSFKEVANAQDY